MKSSHLPPPDGSPAQQRPAAPDADDDRDLAGYAELFEMSIDHLCVAGFDGYWKRLNPSWSRTLGWTEDELMSAPLIEFVHPGDREVTLFARGRLTEGEPLRALSNRYRCKDGTYRWFEWRSVANVERGLVYAIARDVTAEKEAERTLRELGEKQEQLQRQLMLADRLASVGTLAAGVAHEINNPLAYVMVNLDTMIEDMGSAAGGPPPAFVAEWARMAAEAREGVERIRKIVRGLMTFSRAEEERRETIDVRPVLELSINMVHNEIRHRARLLKEYGPIPLVEADDSRLGQVFINLLVNAAQAMPDRNLDANEIRVLTSTDADGQAVIEVRDTGPGIPPDLIEKIFDPFFTTKAIGVGTGLGLAICHTIVSAMGGRITASTHEAGGARFVVTLPAAPFPVAEPRPAKGGLERAPAKRRAAVLVVDDERAVGDSLRRVIGDHDVTVVTSAREALALVASDARFDVIFSDVMMPEMSGVELYDAILRVRPGDAERVVFVTGGAFTEEAKAFLERVPNERVDKPFDRAAVRELVARFVED